MKLSTNSWHYRLLEWTYGDVPKSLCPYVDKLLLAIIGSPFIALFRIAHNIRIWLPLFLWLVFSSIFDIVIGKWWLIFVILGIAGVGILISMVVSAIVDDGIDFGWITNLFKRKSILKPKKPNIVKEYLSAKHRRLCPILTFYDEEEKTIV